MSFYETQAGNGLRLNGVELLGCQLKARPSKDGFQTKKERSEVKRPEESAFSEAFSFFSSLFI